MRKIYLLVASAFIGATSFGQSNLDFETWVGGSPSNWGVYGQEAINLNTVIAASGGTATATPVVQSTPPAEGTYAAKLTSFTLSGASNSQYDGDWGSQLSQLFTISQKIESVSFQFKSQIGATDSAAIYIEVYNDNGTLNQTGDNIIGIGSVFIKGNNTAWTTGTVNLTYFSADVPQSARIVAISSAGDLFNNVAPIVPGSVLEVDDFQITYSSETPAANVTNVVATDISNNGNGTDLEVSFTVPATESTDVEKYYVTVFAPGVSPGMLANPLAFMESNAIEITPNGNNQTHTFDASDVYWSVSGSSLVASPIVEDVPLVVWVYVEGKTGKSDVYASSNQITLTSPLSVLGINAEAVRMFPNPATDVLNIEFGTESVTNVNVINLNGQMVSTNAVDNGTVKLDVSNLQSGMYIYQAIDSNGNILKVDRFSKK